MAASESILSLDDASIGCILTCSSQLTHQDLLRVSRCCRRLHRLVTSGEHIWQQQYQQQYGPASLPIPSVTTSSSGNVIGYQQLFKGRCVREAKERRMQLKLQRYKLQSDITTLQRDLKQLKARLVSEQQLQERLCREMKQLQHVRQAKAASQHWHLSSVQLYHNKVVQAAPVSLKDELASLQQQQRVSQVEVKTLQAGISARQSRLAGRMQQLEALRG